MLANLQAKDGMFCGAVLAGAASFLDIFRVAFIGHREVNNFSIVERELDSIVERLIEGKEYVEFYMGRNGEFDIMAASAVKRIQNQLGDHNSCLILVLPYEMADMPYLEEYYQEIVFPLSKNAFPKAAIEKRNQWLLDNCDLLVAYVEHTNGGAAKLLGRAIRMHKDFYLIDTHNKTE